MARVLVIDELHNILGAKENVGRQFLNLIRFLGNELRIPIVISTDAHVTTQFNFMSYGVSIARRSWLEKEDIANTLEVKQLLKKLKPFNRT